ncbi:MAG TPA: tRNA pseudouridine(55) synthase TruB [Terriglobia bacterium]|nr:tRNA pseudouridine(55) synthase TruB [Terriglobia bacterium]
MDGILIIDKPGGITSHDVVQRVRKLLKTSKVGHLGTLDPMATGVLLLCIGKATRVGRFLPSSPKEYVGEIRFGFATTTYDREGEGTGPEQVLTHGRAEIQAAMSRLTGAFDQKPPVISAKKMGGIPSYKLARRGMALEPIAVSVEVSTFEITSFSAPLAGFRVVCSSGTYVRSLAHDLGQQLGCGAHLDSLRRVRSGDFSIERAVPLEQATAENIVPLEDLLPRLPRIEIENELSENRVRHGNSFQTELAPGLACIFNKKGEFLAVAAIENGWAHPRVVLTSTPSAEPRKPH